MEHYYEHPIVRLFIRFLKSENFPIDEKCLFCAFGGTDTYIDWLFLYYIGREEVRDNYTEAERRKYDRIWNRYVLKHYEVFEKYIKEHRKTPNGDYTQSPFKFRQRKQILFRTHFSR